MLYMAFPTNRMRRLRYNPVLREMLGGVRPRRQELIAPLFVREDIDSPQPIASMPGQHQHTITSAIETANAWADAGLQALLLFGIPARKDDTGSGAYDDRGIVQQALAAIRKRLPDMLLITDVCLCEYTSHGHCGKLADVGGRIDVDNDATLELLARTAVSQARAGADMVAPSAMMDGQVAAIRQALDAAGMGHTPIMAYSVKYASSYYGPFRDAAQSAPRQGDRRSYQMDFRTAAQAAQEAQADLDEGADIIMVKPAGPCLDVLARLRQQFDVPIAAYQVSGEYAALKAAAQLGYLDERRAVTEAITAIKRAGADLIITYYAQQLAQWL